MLEVMLLFKLCVKTFHAWRKALAAVVVEVLKSDLVRVGRCFSFENVKVDCVMVAECDQH